MNTRDKEIWFPAKRYGWGWGFPVNRKGWVFLAIWTATLLAGIAVLSSRATLFYGLLAFIVVMAFVLILVCFIKGEKPRWRWGD